MKRIDFAIIEDVALQVQESEIWCECQCISSIEESPFYEAIRQLGLLCDGEGGMVLMDFVAEEIGSMLDRRGFSGGRTRLARYWNGIGMWHAD